MALTAESAWISQFYQRQRLGKWKGEICFGLSWQEGTAAGVGAGGRVASLVRKQREMNTDAQLALVRTQPVEHCHPHSG